MTPESDRAVAASEKRDEKAIKLLQEQKFSSREKLRAARIEMGQIDQKLFKAGGNIADLNMVCW